MITKAVSFSFDRHPKILSDQIFKISLQGLTAFSDVVSRIAQVLKLPSSSKPTEKSVVQDISKLTNFTLLGFTTYSFVEDAQNQK
jgi:hypothetical protein